MNLEKYKKHLIKHTMVLTFFTGKNCSVCTCLKPRVEALIANEFPETHFLIIETQANREICGQYTVFSLPTILIHVEGKEHKRLTRNIFLDDVRSAIERPYGFLF